MLNVMHGSIPFTLKGCLLLIHNASNEPQFHGVAAAATTAITTGTTPTTAAAAEFRLIFSAMCDFMSCAFVYGKSS